MARSRRRHFGSYCVARDDVSGERNKKHRYNEKSNQYEVLISWKGLDDEDDSWEPMTAMFADIKVMMTKYLQNELAKKPNVKLKSFKETLV